MCWGWIEWADCGLEPSWSLLNYTAQILGSELWGGREIHCIKQTCTGSQIMGQRQTTNKCGTTFCQDCWHQRAVQCKGSCWGVHTVQLKLQWKLQVELWVAGMGGKGPWTADPFCNKGPGDLWPARWGGHSETREEPMITGVGALKLWVCKSPGIPLFGVPPWREGYWRHQTRTILLFSYWIKIKLLKDLDI